MEKNNPHLKLKVYKLTIDDDPESGIGAVALVDDPAIQVNWLTFKEEKPITFAIQSEEQRIISGPLMIPDKPIFRKGQDGMADHYVLFDAETIRKCALKFFRTGQNKNVNLMHDPDAQAPGVYLFESFLIDPERGIKAPEEFKDLPAGAWFGSYKVDNDAIWNEFIKTQVFQGFSIEGFFKYSETPQKNEFASEDDALLDAIIKILEEVKF